MGCLISDTQVRLTPTGNLVPIAGGQLLRAFPSRTDCRCTSQRGQTFLWSKNPLAKDPAWAHAVEFTSDATTGIWEVWLPFTDTEVSTPDGGPVQWWIQDTVSGHYYHGPLPAAVGASASLSSLLISHGWVCDRALQTQPPDAVVFSATVTFGAGQQTQAVAFGFSVLGYKVVLGTATDADGNLHQVAVDASTIENTGFTLKLGAPVPTGKAVNVFYAVVR